MADWRNLAEVAVLPEPGRAFTAAGRDSRDHAHFHRDVLRWRTAFAASPAQAELVRTSIDRGASGQSEMPTRRSPIEVRRSGALCGSIPVFLLPPAPGRWPLSTDFRTVRLRVVRGKIGIEVFKTSDQGQRTKDKAP